LAAAADHIARYKTVPGNFHAEETVGVHVNGNPYGLDGYRFMEFKLYDTGHLPRYEFSVDKYPSEADAAKWRNWLSVAKSKFNGLDYVEGVVFWDKKTGMMAKLRRDMF
jgi:predicted ester cyclase